MSQEKEARSEFARGVLRAAGGALIFGVPLLLTMEMWWLGFSMHPLRLLLLVLLTFFLLVRLTHFSGFSREFRLIDRLVAAAISFLIGFLMSGIVLLLIGELDSSSSFYENIGKIILQSVPASIGAAMSRSILDSKGEEEDSKTKWLPPLDEIFLRVVGALIIGLTASPTEEMYLIATQLTPWQGLGLVVLSMGFMHLTIVAVEQKSHHSIPDSIHFKGIFSRFTVVGYATALLVSALLLWSFGRFDGAGLTQIVHSTLVLGFPAALGAAAVRMLL